MERVERAKTVLLAEDDETIRAMVARQFERRGCRVLAVADGLEALALFRDHVDEVDLAVLDVRMPNLEGPQALLEMLALRPRLAAIVVSGFADSNADLGALLRGGVRFVPKPVRASQLVEVACEMMDAAAGER
jgi:CheY-like chemotaxis protein